MYRTLKSDPYNANDLLLPAKQVLNWDINKESCALLVHDMQKYFVNSLPKETAENLVNSTVNVLHWARQNDIQVIYSAQPGRMSLEQRGLLADLWGPGMRTCEEDRQVIHELAPQSDDIILTKWRYSAFFQSELEEILSARGCDSLVITGLYASIGIQATAIDAFTRNVRPIVVADATADFTKLSHQQALNYMSDTCAKVISKRELDNYE
ncbi:Phenazine biosynthesis protein PhzD [Vibrio crassostreae]|uniref:isochorismatase family protein n=1 Tax=Vibrio crassostreae TaxID=246167 RepID=UPI0010D96F15|nr:isochorismatase family protein [Vibrio crassostreae]TCN75902.1 isochorismate hydrolase [Vibrio crassostreae]CAK2533058.1 Phenazine biosynthesis protein PhzD [Vibrio crassostreae]CAK3889358.1 Phenazine biosynthesis protein PhzD [Vibrio crassostreae]